MSDSERISLSVQKQRRRNMGRLINEVGEGLTTSRYVSFQYLIGFVTTSVNEVTDSYLSHNQYSRLRKVLDTS